MLIYEIKLIDTRILQLDIFFALFEPACLPDTWGGRVGNCILHPGRALYLKIFNFRTQTAIAIDYRS